MQVIKVGAISVCRSLNHNLFEPFTAYLTVGRVQNHRHNLLKRRLTIVAQRVLVMPKAASIAEANPVVFAIHHDGLTGSLRLKAQMLTDLTNVLTALLLSLLRLIYTLRHRAQSCHHDHEEQNHHRGHQISEGDPERLLSLVF
ncbi:hypothetical protein D3C71_1645010 [compost metagenome]